MGFLIGQRWGNREHLRVFWLIGIAAWNFKTLDIPWLLRVRIGFNPCFSLAEHISFITCQCIDKAQFLCPARTDYLTLSHHLKRLLHADEAHQALSPTAAR